jgi:lipopolysaccharide/colanic/teichoic acid biosynthesis glycosyltransferase
MKSSNHIPLGKRVFDVTVTGLLLLCLSPLFLLIMLLIRLESKGPVFYYSYRVGQGYKTFKFYKFRSMRVNADQMVEKMKHLNQYGTEEKTGPKEIKLNRKDFILGLPENLIVGDDKLFDAREFEDYQKNSNQSAFVKFKNDPRITRVGKFIRNTSIDELPQLFNIIRGDMSLVGNRPLPLYEAEKLTTDACVGRFLAPAGLTGLWQVTERGKSDMTPESRTRLDIEYAKKRNFWLDLWILMKTPVAAFQHENV